jgi:hypothetical protein
VSDLIASFKLMESSERLQQLSECVFLHPGSNFVITTPMFKEHVGHLAQVQSRFCGI